jgi:hypothetical protein
MALHPDERPHTVNDFRQALLGYSETPTLPLAVRRAHQQSLLDYLSNSEALGSTAVLFLVSLLATLVR